MHVKPVMFTGDVPPPAAARVCTAMARPILPLLVTPMVLAVAACSESEAERLERLYAQASAAGPAAAQAGLIAEWNAKAITLNNALNLAHERVEKADPGAVPFAMAVLGAIDALEGPIEKAGVNEFFWYRVGTLAGAAAAQALKARDLASARALVLAEPVRWQNDSFWLRHPDHDAMASLILHWSGESGAAVARLRARPDLDEGALAVLQRIEAESRSQQPPK